MDGEQSFTEEEIGLLRTLLEVEKIRKKINLYSHLLDGLEHEKWAALFAEDVVVDWGSYGRWEGRERIYQQVKTVFAGRPPYFSLHMTTNPYIEMTGPATATSRAYLLDINADINPRITPVRFLGIYEVDWAKIDGDWKMKRHCVRFVWPERATADDFPNPMTPSLIG